VVRRAERVAAGAALQRAVRRPGLDRQGLRSGEILDLRGHLGTRARVRGRLEAIGERQALSRQPWIAAMPL
jgi:hypothetical protein